MTKSEHTQSIAQSVAQPAPLLLAGAGHAHLVVMRQWLDSGWRPPVGSVLINADARAWYSGMMPGLIAGRFTLDACVIELAPVCQQLGITLIQAEIVALDSGAQLLELNTGELISYQYLSINTGSRPLAPEHNDGSVLLLAAKPFAEFIEQWQNWLQSPPISLMVLGGGAAAFELAMAINTRLRQTLVSVVCSGTLLDNLAPGTQILARRRLTAAGIKLIENCRIDRIARQSVWSGNKKVLSPDAIVLATGASPHSWYQSAGLDCDEAGFICVNKKLCAVRDGSVFTSGDAAALRGSQRSGVFSVRHGPVLAHNIKAAMEKTVLINYQPQTRALVLLATGDGGALMSYGRFALGGRFIAPLLGRWKDYLDLSFMKRHRV